MSGKQVIYHFRTRGTGPEGVHIAGIANGFEAAGYAVDFVSPTDRDPRDHRGDNPFHQSKESLVQKLSRRAPQLVFELGEMAYNRNALAKMEAKMEPVDWIYERYAFFGHAARSMRQKHGIPYALEINELAGDARVRKQVLTKVARDNEKRILMDAKAVFPVSQYLAERIAEIGVPRERIHVVGNGVDAEHFWGGGDRQAETDAVRKRLGLNPDARAFCFVGWFVEWHRLDALLEAFAGAFRGKADRKLVLAGDGPLKETLLAQAAELGIAKQLLLPGAIPYGEIPIFLRAMDVGIVPHVNAFRSPIKLFEYMAAGLPIVAGAVDAVTSVLPDAQLPYLFDQESPDGLKAALSAIDQTSGDLGANNRLACEQKYTYQQHARFICQLMEGHF